MAQPPALKLPRELALAERWAKDSGRTVERTRGRGPEGEIPAIVIKHGAYPIVAYMEHKCVRISASAQVAQQVRDKLTRLVENDQRRVLIALTNELLSNARTGYDVVPHGLASVTGLEQINVAEIIALSEEDPGSRNRFMDAVQEVVTVMVRALRILAIAGDQPPPTTSMAPSSPPPEMYR